jgi:putative aldouronate transport system substrate-binding protein
MRGLYDEGLYSPRSFTQDNQQMNMMANDSRDVIGAFISPGITLTVLQNSPELMERYVGIGPLTGPDGVQLTTVFVPIPWPNGVITSACQYPEEVFKLFDLMLSEEACLMGRYGEQGVDWDFAEDGDISIFGTPATIRIINQIWNTPQNKHLMQICPYVSRPKYSGGVTWDGNTTDGEYMNAQAALLHMGFEPEEFIGALIFTPEEEMRISIIRADIETHIRTNIVDFITGSRNVFDDAQWAAYLMELDDLGLAAFIQTAQAAWDRQAK